jgi:hypothetical protein
MAIMGGIGRAPPADVPLNPPSRGFFAFVSSLVPAVAFVAEVKDLGGGGGGLKGCYLGPPICDGEGEACCVRRCITAVVTALSEVSPIVWEVAVVLLWLLTLLIVFVSSLCAQGPRWCNYLRHRASSWQRSSCGWGVSGGRPLLDDASGGDGEPPEGGSACSLSS